MAIRKPKPESLVGPVRLAGDGPAEKPATPGRPWHSGKGGRLRLPFPPLPHDRPGLSAVAFRLDSERGRKARAILDGLAADRADREKATGIRERPLRAAAVFELLLDCVDLADPADSAQPTD